MSAPKVILKFTFQEGPTAWVVFDHIVHWEPRKETNGSFLFLSNGRMLAVTETCEQIEKHIQSIGRGGF